MKLGDQVDLLTTGRRAVVRNILGEGGQGHVFAVDVDGTRQALKWYHPHAATPNQRAVILDLIERRPPNNRFLWPLELAERRAAGEEGFGYTMPVRPDRFVSMASVMADANSLSTDAVCTAAYQLADAFLRVHAQGLCYRDISFGNVFVDPTDGSALVCDNDNIGIDGGSISNVLGTRRFMAPEIVRGQALPSRATDLYSLSVLLFYLLMWGHPLSAGGRTPTRCGITAPSPTCSGATRCSSSIPTTSRTGPCPTASSAPTGASGRALSASCSCGRSPPGCTIRGHGCRRASGGASSSALGTSSPSARSAAQSRSGTRRRRGAAGRASRDLAPPLRLQFSNTTVVLRERTELSAHHLLRNWDFQTPLAAVARHPERPDQWGLRNTGSAPWRLRDLDGEEHVVEAGRAVGLLPGIRIDFGGGVADLLDG